MRPSDPPAVIIQRSPGSALNARDQPTTVGSSVLFTIPSREQVKLLDVEQTDFGQRFRWFKVEYSGRQAWVREDYCRVTGDTEALGLPWDLYPAPMADRSWWVRDYNYKPFQDTNVWEHWGWDFGAEAGTPILAGPYGGKVAQVMDCAKCTEQRPSTLLNGLALGDPSTLSDPGWGFGYGNFVVVGYKWDLLPDSTQNWMRESGYENGSAFVLYGHLQSRNVEAGQSLHAEQIIGKCGNTGNSQAPHLHLELRLAKSDHYPGWASLMNGLTNPVVLFSR
jgi:murein DD-endopeptidase MepM/ murein hydrolase activator NlpD